MLVAQVSLQFLCLPADDIYTVNMCMIDVVAKFLNSKPYSG